MNRALDLIAQFLNEHQKKATIHQIQKLCGFLNFLCQCVIPGRAFTRRLYAYTTNGLPHHHVRINREMKLDLEVWRQFLMFPGIFCHPFMEFTELSADDVMIYSDASRNFKKGFGAYFETQWTYGVWDEQFMEWEQPSIEFLELFGVTVAVLLWIKNFPNKRICLFCDNESAVHMINNSSSKCKQCMVLIRLNTLESLVNNVRVFAKYVNTKKNGIADSLSHLDFRRF